MTKKELDKNKAYSPREFKTILAKNGYKKIRTKGDHEIFKKENNMIIIPATRINKMIARRLIKENNLEV